MNIIGKIFGQKEQYVPRTISKYVPKIISEKKDIFSEIIGYEELKRMVQKALVSEFNINMLLDGPPGTGKTQFLRCIEKKYGKHCRFLDCTLMTKAGLRDFLFNNQHIKILLLDEISRLKRTDQEVLLNLATSGEVIDSRYNKNAAKITFKNLKIFCTSNNKEKLIAPVADRMEVWHCKEYSKEQFESIGDYRLFMMGIKDEALRQNMIDSCYDELNSKSIRDLEDMAKYVRNAEDLTEYLEAKAIHTEEEETD